MKIGFKQYKTPFIEYIERSFFMYYVDKDGRFVVPFLVGALTGGAAVSITRPRPVVATTYPMYPQPVYPQPFYPQGPYFY